MCTTSIALHAPGAHQHELHRARTEVLAAHVGRASTTIA
jgi:hypothetical protein